MPSRLRALGAIASGRTRASASLATTDDVPLGEDDVVTLVELVAAGVLARLPVGRDRVLVGIDGPDAAGKTTLADALVDRLDRTVVRASIDGFHRPREQRLARGALSPEGYYRDSFDLDALRARLLLPFAHGAARVRTAAYDHVDDRAATVKPIDVPARAALVVDGVFLLRPELRDAWDVAVHLHVPPEVTLARAITRDLALFGDEATLRERYERRYLPGQELYRAEADPWAGADLVVDASDPEHPVVLGERTRRG